MCFFIYKITVKYTFDTRIEPTWNEERNIWNRYILIIKTQCRDDKRYLLNILKYVQTQLYMFIYKSHVKFSQHIYYIQRTRSIAKCWSILITICNNTSASEHLHLSNANYLIRVAIFGKPSLNICWMFIWCISSLQCVSKCDHSPSTCQTEIGIMHRIDHMTRMTM